MWSCADEPRHEPKGGWLRPFGPTVEREAPWELPPDGFARQLAEGGIAAFPKPLRVSFGWLAEGAILPWAAESFRIGVAGLAVMP
jgi:hypothetical protein